MKTRQVLCGMMGVFVLAGFLLWIAVSPPRSESSSKKYQLAVCVPPQSVEEVEFGHSPKPSYIEESQVRLKKTIDGKRCGTMGVTLSSLGRDALSVTARGPGREGVDVLEIRFLGRRGKIERLLLPPRMVADDVPVFEFRIADEDPGLPTINIHPVEEGFRLFESAIE